MHLVLAQLSESGRGVLRLISKQKEEQNSQIYIKKIIIEEFQAKQQTAFTEYVKHESSLYNLNNPQCYKFLLEIALSSVETHHVTKTEKFFFPV